MTSSIAATNGAAGHATDESIDQLYAWFPPQVPAPAPLPEAAFSLTVKGRLDGTEAMLTVRGATAAEFKANLQAVRGLLEPLAPQAPPTADTPQCPTHGAMKRSTKGKGWYCPHKLKDGTWCKEKGR
jgi:hypothetical protein